jgi:hypothetical protein
MRDKPYVSAVGALMYLAIATRPDIAHTVGVLCRFMSKPGPAHWKAAKHLFRYLRGSVDYRLTYAPDPSSSQLFTTYSDADHGGNPDNGRSTSAYVVKMGTGAVSWMSRLHAVHRRTLHDRGRVHLCRLCRPGDRLDALVPRRARLLVRRARAIQSTTGA